MIDQYNLCIWGLTQAIWRHWGADNNEESPSFRVRLRAVDKRFRWLRNTNIKFIASQKESLFVQLKSLIVSFLFDFWQSPFHLMKSVRNVQKWNLTSFFSASPPATSISLTDSVKAEIWLKSFSTLPEFVAAMSNFLSLPFFNHFSCRLQLSLLRMWPQTSKLVMQRRQSIRGSCWEL